MNAHLPLFSIPVAPKGAIAKLVRDVLVGVLPPGVPPPFAEIVSAAVAGAGRHRQIRAELRMIDGLPATVVFTARSLGGWSFRYHDMPGGALSWERGSWVRFPEDG